MLVPTSQLSAQSHKQFLKYGAKGGQKYSYCYGNAMKRHKRASKNRDTPDFITVPDQPSHGHSNKPTFSQIAQALPEL